MAVLGIIGLLGYGLVKKGDGGVGIGSPVPAKTLTQVGSEQPVGIGDYRGRWVLLNVWASWCDPCRGEAPALQSFYAANRSKLTVVGVDTRDLTDDALGFVGEFGLTYPQWHDGDGSYAHDLGAIGVPESFLVDPRGTLIAHFPGPFRNVAEISAFAKPALRAG